MLRVTARLLAGEHRFGLANDFYLSNPWGQLAHNDNRGDNFGNVDVRGETLEAGALHQVWFQCC